MKRKLDNFPRKKAKEKYIKKFTLRVFIWCNCAKKESARNVRKLCGLLYVINFSRYLEKENQRWTRETRRNQVKLYIEIISWHNLQTFRSSMKNPVIKKERTKVKLKRKAEGNKKEEKFCYFVMKLSLMQFPSVCFCFSCLFAFSFLHQLLH